MMYDLIDYASHLCCVTFTHSLFDGTEFNRPVELNAIVAICVVTTREKNKIN